MKYTCLNPIASVGLDQFTEGYEKTEKMEDADAVLVRSAAMHDLELPDGLYAVARAGAGVNNIPLDKCAEKGIVVFNTPGANANGVKELVIAGMLLAARDIVGGMYWVRSERQNEDLEKMAEKEKKRFAGTELLGKKLGVIGLGAIGILVANAAAALGMEVYGYDPYISVEAAWKLYESGEAEVFILSAVLDDSRYAISEKDAWLNEYLSFVDVDHRIYVEGSVPKHLRVPGGVRMTDVLVDDYTKNLKEWPVFGDAKFGRAVKLLNGINGTNGTWAGISVSRFFTPKSIADVILKVGRPMLDWPPADGKKAL